MKDKVVVTGGAGFIGSHLAKRLVIEGADVTVFDSLQLDYGRLNNLKGVLSEIHYIRGDIRDFSSVVHALKGADMVFHLAAISHLPVCHSNPLQAFEVNYGGTLNVLEASRTNDVERVIFAGTDHIYGSPQYLPIDEKHPYNADDAYSLSKAQSIKLCELYRKNYGLDTRILISGNVFGEFQDQSKVIPVFIRQAFKNEPLTVKGGKQTRDFYYVGNLINAYLLIANGQDLKGAILNVGGDDELSVYDLAQKVIALTGSHSKIATLDYRYDDSPEMRLFLDKSKIIQLGYRTSVKFDEGLKRTLEWYQKEPQ